MLKEDEVEQVWPDNRPLLNFVNSGVAVKNIETFINDYFDQLSPLLSEVRNDVLEQSGSARRTLRKLVRGLIEYDTSMAIGGNFVRYVG